MNNIASLLKAIAIFAAVALAGFILYQIYKAIKAGQSAWQGAADAIAKAKASLTPGWSSTVPTPGNMPPEMAQRWAGIQAGEPNLNSPTPNANVRHWWDRNIGQDFRRLFNLGGTTGTTQTLGTQQNSVNLDPLTIKNFAPSAAGGQVTAPLQSGTGTDLGSYGSNSLPPPSNGIAPPDAKLQPSGSEALNYVAPGGSSVTSGATGGLNTLPPSGEPDTSQLTIVY